MKFNLLYALLLITFISFGQQIPEDIKPPSWNLEDFPDVEPYKVASFDLKKLQIEDKINDKDKSIPWRFGHDIYVDHNFNEVGLWTILDNGDRIWRMSYTSEGAYSLNFMFDVFKIPEGAKLYVYNNEKTELLRPFTHHNNNAEEVLGTWLVKGNQAWIEYYQPANVIGKAKITVGSVIHGYRTAETYQKALNNSGACNQDVDCDITPAIDPYGLDTVKENVKTANAMITVNTGTGICSGTLVNNTDNDGTPYFMTANHCSGGEAGWAFRFNWRSPNPSCSTFTNSTDGTFNQTVSGATVRANSSQSDMELVQITDANFFNNNPDVVWAGWNRSITQVPNVNFGIHHPSGDIQKVCREDDGAYRAVVGFNGNANTQMWYIDEWELGVTEPGSSGSGLFNETGHLIGMLSGGAAACSGTINNGAFDYYGRFDVAWDFGSTSSSRLKEWLDPSNSGVNVLDQYPSLETYDIDARVSAGSNELVICGEFSPEVTLFNPGNLQLTSADVSYYIDSESSTSISWSGNLASGGSAVVATPTYSNLSPGNHSFTISVNNPNATTDENTSNDTFVFNFEALPPYTTSEVVFNLTTDEYGVETSWELVNSSGIVVSSGPFAAYGNEMAYVETIAIPAYDGCYTFNIMDSFGDGICCEFGIGSYNLEDDNGNVIIAGGDFSNSESVVFHVQDPLSVDEFNLESLIDFYPNPVRDDLHISLNSINEDVNYEIFNTIGQRVSKGSLEANNEHVLDMSQYQGGIYFIKISTASYAMTKKIIKK